ncbi:tellurite resistance TerB family protein [Photobacterium minamisatsumaniensis]|uniref:tellurite resistance TerB family protein n=1 Tax=Photobacterium minamisatsumaniensis TaxID=2910233 RepID=UPI003D13FBCB
MSNMMNQLLNQAGKYFEGSNKSSSSSGLLKGAIGGGLVSTLVGSKKSRKLAKKYGKKAAVVGGTALIGTLGYQAYKKWQQGETTEGVPALEESGIEQDGGCIAPELLIQAMVYAAKSDGHIDDAEREAISQWMNEQNVKSDAEMQIAQWIDSPLDPSVISSQVHNLAQASEVYLASLLVIDVDHFLERAYLDQLAKSLSLPEALIVRIEEQATRG